MDDYSLNDNDADLRWMRVAQSGEVAEGTAIEAVLGKNIVAVFRCEGHLTAIDGMCAHQGGPLAEGDVADGCVTCPWHGWQYEVDTGIQTINRKPLQRIFEVRETDGHIEVRVPVDAETS